MSAHSRRKGGNGEREVVALMRSHGIQAERTFNQIAGDRSDLRGKGLEGYAFEVKRVGSNLKLWSALAQAEEAAGAGEVPVLAFRRDRGQWYACLPLDELVPLMKRGAA